MREVDYVEVAIKSRLDATCRASSTRHEIEPGDHWAYLFAIAIGTEMSRYLPRLTETVSVIIEDYVVESVDMHRRMNADDALLSLCEAEDALIEAAGAVRKAWKEYDKFLAATLERRG